MLVGAVNFGMHWYAWRRATIEHYQADSELRTFLIIVAVASVVRGDPAIDQCDRRRWRLLHNLPSTASG